MREPEIISSGQKNDHYEIASYETLRQFAEMIGLTEPVSHSEASFNEEKVADEKSSEVAQSINFEAAEEELETKSSK